MKKKTVRPENLRSINMSLVLSHVLSAEQPPSRAQVAGDIGLTRATASKLGDELVEGGILEEVTPPPTQRPGRPAQVLLGSRQIIGLGLDIGVESQRAVAVNLQGEQVASAVSTTDLRKSDALEELPALTALVTEVCEQLPPTSRIAGLTISVPGLVDAASGTLLDAPNLGWHDVNICDEVASHLPKSGLCERIPHPRIGNEANLASIPVAYRAPGAPSPFNDFAYLSGGIGVGAAMVSKHKVITGEHGWAGEIGHLTVDPHGIPCRCGSNGCLERYIGGEALETALAPGNEEELEQSATALGIALATVINLLDVSTVVLGGGITGLYERTQDTVSAVIEKRAMAARRHPIQIVSASAGEEASALGAAYFALEPVIKNPAEFLTPAN
ncbi:MAG: ROK family protein [Actinomycetaceae bacterium]|nr:ROK family protein [Actinomycetaceae bacterium]